MAAFYTFPIPCGFYLRTVQNVSLLSLSKGSGCGCKINPEVLSRLLQGFTANDSFPQLLVGNDLSDDCSVYDLGNGQLLLQTVDFFTPIVNDAFVFGAAAASNALSDVWAMGGKPIMANAVFSWPLDVLPLELGKQVMEGALSICNQANVPLAGGHSIDGKEPLFGLSVTGLCPKQNLKRNSGASAGDCIVLTKPLGSGMLAAAHKRGQSSEEQNQALFALITEMNKVGELLGNCTGVSALTDITGFGLAGHLLEICRGSGVGAEIQIAEAICHPAAVPLAKTFVMPDNAMRNWNAYQNEIELNDQQAFPWLVDPQTNGGLLAAVKLESLPEVKALLLENGSKCLEIGYFTNDFRGLKVISA